MLGMAGAFEPFAREVRHAASAARPERELAWLRLGETDELPRRFRRRRRIHHENIRAHRDHRDGHEILLHIVVHFLQERIRNHRPEIPQKHRVSVRRLLRGVFHADRSGCAWLRVDEALLSPCIRELLSDNARHHVRAPASGIGHDEPHDPGRIRLGYSRARTERHGRGCAGEQRLRVLHNDPPPCYEMQLYSKGATF
jgi:hypothetical protein